MGRTYGRADPREIGANRLRTLMGDSCSEAVGGTSVVFPGSASGPEAALRDARVVVRRSYVDSSTMFSSQYVRYDKLNERMEERRKETYTLYALGR